jgi:hypothetical protein
MLELRRRAMMSVTSFTTTNFLERSDLLGTYYSSLQVAINSLKTDYPSGLTQNVTINCVKRAKETRNPSDTNKLTNLRI